MSVNETERMQQLAFQLFYFQVKTHLKELGEKLGSFKSGVEDVVSENQRKADD